MALLHRSPTVMRGTKDHNVNIQQYSQFYKSYEHPINILFLVALSASVFYNSLWSYYLIVDDLGPVAHTIRGIAELFTRKTYGFEQGGTYRPIELLSHMFDIYLYGEDPFGRHLTNVLTHICNVTLVYGIAFSLTRIKGISLLAGLLFATHPVHSQSLPPVAWISGRTDLLVTLFYLMAVFLFMEFSKKQGLLLYIGSLMAFGLALLSKEMAITLPLVIIAYIIFDPWDDYKDGYGPLNETHDSSAFKLLLAGGIISFIFGLIFNTSIIERYLSADGVLETATVRNIHLFQIITITGGLLTIGYSLFAMYRRNSGKLYQCVKFGMPYFIILLIYIFSRSIILGGVGGSYDSEAANLFLQIGIDTFLRDIYSLAGLIWPVGISYNLDIFTLQIDHSYIFYIVGVAAMAMLIIILFGCLKYSKALAFSYSWIFITLIPVHNIVIASWHFQPRYLYLPSVGFCTFVSILLYRGGLLNLRIWSFRKILVVGSISLYVLINMTLIRGYNEKLDYNGEITRELVTQIKNIPSNSSESKNLIFLTFPLSSIDTLNAPWIRATMHQVLPYAVAPRFQASKYSYQHILFSNHRENVGFNISSPEDGVFELDVIGDGSFFLVPKDRAVMEKKIESIYKVLPREVWLRPIPSEGGYEETKEARINVLALDKRTKRVSLRIELKEASPRSGKPYFYIFDQGHFKLLPVKTYGAETEYLVDDSVQPKAL